MRIGRRKQRDEKPPQGVRIIRADGTEIRCDVLRDPDGDVDGCACWVAVPGVPGTNLRQDDVLRVAVLPGMSFLKVRAEMNRATPG